MKKWTMREAYEELGVSRTTLQGWVDDILDKPTGVNENGWYFNEDDLEKLQMAKTMQLVESLSLTIKNITAI